MKKILIAILMFALTGAAFGKDRPKWETGYYRVMKAQNADQVIAANADGYHITLGTDNYTCQGGDDHNAPDCGSDASWAGVVYSGRAVGFADGTGYACEIGSCPDWISFNLDPAMHGVAGTFLYRVNKKGELEIKNWEELKTAAPVLDGKKHDLREGVK